VLCEFRSAEQDRVVPVRDGLHLEDRLGQRIAGEVAGPLAHRAFHSGFAPRQNDLALQRSTNRRENHQPAMAKNERTDLGRYCQAESCVEVVDDVNRGCGVRHGVTLRRLLWPNARVPLALYAARLDSLANPNVAKSATVCGDGFETELPLE